jgi:hypothetical protein
MTRGAKYPPEAWCGTWSGSLVEISPVALTWPRVPTICEAGARSCYSETLLNVEIP